MKTPPLASTWIKDLVQPAYSQCSVISLAQVVAEMRAWLTLSGTRPALPAAAVTASPPSASAGLGHGEEQA